LNDWCLTSTLAVFQQYRGAETLDNNEFIAKIFHFQAYTTMQFIVQLLFMT